MALHTALVRQDLLAGWEHWFSRHATDLPVATKNGWTLLYSTKAISQLYGPVQLSMSPFIWIQYQLSIAKKASYAKSALPVLT